MNEKNRTHLCFTFNSYFAFFTLFFFNLTDPSQYESLLILIIALERKNVTIKLMLMFFSYQIEKEFREGLFSLYQNWRFFFVLQCFYETLLCLDHVSCSIFFFPFAISFNFISIHKFCDVIRVPFWHLYLFALYAIYGH